jgi:hypothetical protein
MAQTKSGVRVSLGDGHGVPTGNASGFNSRTLGSDTKPGRERGAPLLNEKRSDDSTVRRSHYADGINPYGMTRSRQHDVIRLDGVAPSRDGPIHDHGEQPNRHATSKAGEVLEADGQAGLGAHFTGTATR